MGLTVVYNSSTNVLRFGRRIRRHRERRWQKKTRRAPHAPFRARTLPKRKEGRALSHPALASSHVNDALPERLVHVSHHAVDGAAARTAMAASASSARAIAVPAVVVTIAQAARHNAAHRQHGQHGDDKRDDDRRRRPNQTHHRCASFLTVRYRGRARKRIPKVSLSRLYAASFSVSSLRATFSSFLS